jgi:tight adherence protein B
MESVYYLFILFGFLAVVLAIEGGFLAWNNGRGEEAQRLRRRLRAMAAGEHGTAAEALLKRRTPAGLTALERLFLRLPRVGRIERLLLQAGSSQSVGRLLLICVAAAGTALLLGLLLRWPLWLVLAVAGGAGFYPLWRLFVARRKRLFQLEQQLPDALDLMGRALLAGHAFSAALGMVGTETSEPIAGEFRTTFDEINFGVPLQEAMLNLGTRVPSPDLGYFIISVLLQRETGGNLSELLGNLSALIRARFKLMGAVRALSAEGRLSAWILSLLPFVAAGAFNLINPKLMSVLWTDPVGLQMVFVAMTMIVVGIFWMWRIVKIRI